ncbi:MAG: LCP family protein [Oscillospiraceae bacterium]|nr:LCP family protein [Oscillospiraceae bacterium]
MSKSVRKKKIILYSVLFFISLVLIVIACFIIYINNVLNSINFESTPDFYSDDANEKQTTNLKVLNVLVLGADARPGEKNGRSDCILVVSINIERKKIKVTSIMRDTWVDIPGWSFDKACHSFAYGGPSLAVQMIEKNFDIKIYRYASIDFSGFEDIVEVLNGISMYLTKEESRYINRYSHDKNYLEEKDGVQHLSPSQALAHVGDRNIFKIDPTNPGNKLGDDYARASRQRDFIKAVFLEFKNCNLGQLSGIISKISTKITTNFKKKELLKFVSNCLKYKNFELEEYAIPESDDYLGCFDLEQGMSILGIKNIKRVRFRLKKFIFEDQNDYDETLDEDRLYSDVPVKISLSKEIWKP